MATILEPEMKHLIQEIRRQQDLVVYTNGSAIKYQPWWGFTVKQGAAAIHEDNTAYTILHHAQTHIQRVRKRETNGICECAVKSQ